MLTLLGFNCTQYKKDELDKIRRRWIQIDSLTYNKYTMNCPRITYLHSSLLQFPVYLDITSEIRTVQSRTSVYYNSFLPAVTRECNDLSDEVKNSPLLNRFKYNIKQRTNRKVPSYLYAGTIQLQIYHARLRMKCRSLNNHLYIRNIVNSLLCRCGNIETNSHFLS